MNLRILRVLLVLVLTSAASSSAFSQLALQIHSIDTSGFPTIRVQLVTRNGVLLRKDLDSTKYVFREDGLRQQPVRKQCPEGMSPFSIAIVIGTGSSMSSGDVLQATGIAGRLVDSLNGFSDEASIVIYNSLGLEQQSMTASKSMLHNALSNTGSYPAFANHLWDGLHVGLQSALAGSSTRSILLLSNGLDDGSSKTQNDIVLAANTANVKIFSVGVNANSGGISTLQSIAAATGGRYFSSVDECIQTIINSQRGNPDWCEFTYVSDNHCREGVLRTLEISVKDGNDSVTTTGQWSVGPDPLVTQTATFRVDSVRATVDNPVVVPLRLAAPVIGQRIWPGTLTLSYDRALLSLVDVRTDSTVAAGLTAQFTETASGADVTLTGSAAIAAPGSVLRLVFRGSTVTTETRVVVTPTAWVMTRGCATSTLLPGSVTIVPKVYSVLTTSTPRIFTWNASSCGYDPTPNVLSAEVTNNGDLPLTGVQLTLPDSPAYRPAGGFGATVSLVPSSLQPGQRGTAQWIVRMTPRDAEASLEIIAAITANEPLNASARMFVNVKAATSAVALTATADTIRVSNQVYTPDPVPVRAVIRAAGSGSGQGGTATIELPSALTLESGSDTQTFADIPTGTSTTLTWPVRYPKNLTRDTTYDIRIRISGSCPAADTVLVRLHVPVEMTARLAGTCIDAPASLAYDSLAKVYPVMTVRGVVRNAGLSASDTVRATLTPASPLELVAGQQSTLRIASIASGDSATFEWQVRVQDGYVGCTQLTPMLTYAAESAGAELISCAPVVTLLRQPNLRPEVTSHAPVTLDTVRAGTQQVFTVQAKDADGDELVYRWVLNGQTVGENRNLHSQIFGLPGMSTLLCVVTDKCPGDSVVVSWTFLVDTTTTSTGTVPLPLDVRITGNYPNPFNPGTVIVLSVGTPRSVVLDILDQSGRTVARVHEGMLGAGTHALPFEAQALPSGVYTARLRTGGTTLTHRMVLTR